MTYHSDKKNNNFKFLRVILMVVFVVSLLFFWKQIKTFAFPVVFPAVEITTKVIDNIFYIPTFFSVYIASQEDSFEKINKLEKNIELLENKIAYQNSQLEYLTNKDDLPLGKGSLTLEASPIIQDLYFLYSTILISKGFKDGVEEGMVVYIRGYQAIGIVTSVHRSTSVVSLLSDSGNKVNGFTSIDKTNLSLVGDGGGNFISKIPKDVEVKIGDFVFLSENPSMVLGSIVEVTGSEQDFFKTIYIRGAYNPVKQSVYFIDK